MSPPREAPTTLQAQLVDALELEAFPARGYRDRAYLEQALAAGFDVAELATAHDVSKRTVYRAAEKHGLELRQPPSNGLSRRLYEADPDAIGGD
ncbi:hypothetical protein [Haloglomus litoreum]|uniref:hypothetical protein n=1 Tax=Haloglomus litoreum TaxID=3034026 RepID=UPI0023E76FA5|nr:hypothetical protein [Haloglomus sp. DT116]